MPLTALLCIETMGVLFQSRKGQIMREFKKFGYLVRYYKDGSTEYYGLAGDVTLSGLKPGSLRLTKQAGRWFLHRMISDSHEKMAHGTSCYLVSDSRDVRELYAHMRLIRDKVYLPYGQYRWLGRNVA